MTEEEFIKAYCIWCDERNYNDASWGKNCYSYERCFERWGKKDETANE